MLVADARVATSRASRYLAQLCRHLDLVAQKHPEMHAHVNCSDDCGVISFGTGRCLLRADQEVLALRVEAPDEECLRQLQQRIAGRLEQIGRRDRLTVAWTPNEAPRSSSHRDSEQPRPATTEGHAHD
ncbi:MAG TPA: DUF2218 domain-containing protein [Jiangellaceae bacterium]